MAIEEWKDVLGFEGMYEISSYGRVRSLSRMVPSVMSKTGFRRMNGRIKKLGNHSAGYKCITIGKSQTFLVHRLVARAFHANPDNKPFVNHKDGNKANNQLENLEWSTRQENETHAYSTGLKNSTGSHNVSAKLTEADVKVILSMKGVCTSDEMHKKYGVHIATINRIWQRVIWKHVA